VFESFVGALFLDQGFVFVRRFVYDVFEPLIRDAEIRLDPKSELQQLLQADGKVNIAYRVIEESGTAQDKHVVASVGFDGIELGRGEGKNKKSAEVEAAKDALSKLAKPQE
ncbi:MAG: ribonuclease III, partial [Bacilli bacterium]|nr:ribonuclease III [Bacilli bacterium]